MRRFDFCEQGALDEHAKDRVQRRDGRGGADRFGDRVLARPQRLIFHRIRVISRTGLTALGETKLARDAQTPRLARATVTAWIGRSHPVRDVLLLVASEMVTNAVRHADTGCWVLVQLFQGIDFLRLTVTDPGSALSAPHLIPTQEQLGDEAEGGRGLAIVAELSRGRWGSHLLLPSMHRAVWCDVDAERHAPPHVFPTAPGQAEFA
ncbi:ATP-binding protein [Nonomuraea glycinis]|uniref:ATP-binding protein n=1 Tax=Nonomuraea glycinis TaxID=2047744 RepID=UPI001663C014|nr:ATP-binding protein [Nonomuraea glycinis]MCA2180422.1 ATP-binding protein [Nonomuraea glycinis]